MQLAVCMKLSLCITKVHIILLRQERKLLVLLGNVEGCLTRIPMIFKKPLVIWLGNEGGSETGDLLGCILPHKRAILVPQTRGFFATIAGSYHEIST